jgi:hypothetical protein
MAESPVTYRLGDVTITRVLEKLIGDLTSIMSCSRGRGFNGLAFLVRAFAPQRPSRREPYRAVIEIGSVYWKFARRRVETLATRACGALSGEPESNGGAGSYSIASCRL